MSVLIKGMETPKSCVNCPIAFFDDGYTILHCPLTAEEFSKNSFIYKRSDNCPLIPVSEHGRLIDADALCKRLRNLAENEYTPAVFANWIENYIETVIPASEDCEK